MLQTLEEMLEDESICEYCISTDCGECKEYVTPSGTYVGCEGAWCEEAYKCYLEENGFNENIEKYVVAVKLVNKEEFEYAN